MLGEEALARANPPLPIDRDPYRLLADGIRQAQRLVLDADMCKAADEVTTTRPSPVLAGLSKWWTRPLMSIFPSNV